MNVLLTDLKPTDKVVQQKLPNGDVVTKVESKIAGRELDDFSDDQVIVEIRLAGEK